MIISAIIFGAYLAIGYVFNRLVDIDTITSISMEAQYDVDHVEQVLVLEYQK